MARCEPNELATHAFEERIGGNENRVGALLRDARECPLEIALAVSLLDVDLQPKHSRGACCLINLEPCGRIAGIR